MSPRRPRSTLGLTTQCLSNSKIKINNNNNKTSTFYSLETKTFLLLFANSILLFQTQNLGLVYLFRLFMPLFPKLPPLSSYPLTQSFVFFFQQYHNYHCYKLKYILTTQTKKCSQKNSIGLPNPFSCFQKQPVISNEILILPLINGPQ